MKITMIGHSTVLLEAEGIRILTDPFFGRWGNPAYARRAPPARKREELQNVDLVLMSHHHFDHIDRSFLRGLDRRTPVCAPRAMAWFTRFSGAGNVAGMMEWEQREFNGVTVTAVPALHLEASLGYVVQAGGKAVYFSGDTFFAPFMNEIGRRFALDAALMPVATFRIPMTMDEQGAVKAAAALKPKVIVPIHEGLIPRSPFLRTRQTPEGFRSRLQAAGNPARVVMLREGESLTL